MTESRYIVIEGSIGVGKTSLARRLAESLDSELLLEQAEANPFLERFYRNPREAALPTQLFFLFQRVRQVEALRQVDIFSDTHIADFLMEKDRLFAQINLDHQELDLYDQVFRSMDITLPEPDLVVYLQAPVDTLLFRIAHRGIDYEKRISRHYLERLNEAYARFFHDYDSAPLLIVNATTIDPIHNDEHYNVLLEEICRIQSGRHFFNPIVSAMA
ncbi:MAG TPA: deoxynucleoside kinase [Gammaproteobacteria bacterium]|jgi:deoxyadenosine/deoxycytidine kinase|nr:deoxynucleoside kinase [Chromatiales bacterium]MCP4924763.1 deoxynucleoside kinase [Gammaproteobacteria bacterium]MDP7153289.1 deoxynucleoside kinase [Gammaproteobacteria bacterium]MDP7297543.1 deoxynucleoside kinase [Gammaproteobacteria bacterium]MDP7659895.1 deoxynucleoside kinase [Gammaproteobacteria bacterium]